MKKTEIVLLFGEEKLEALEFALRKERSSVQRKMDEALKNLYEQTVPEPLREYLGRKETPARERPRRARPGNPNHSESGDSTNGSEGA